MCTVHTYCETANLIASLYSHRNFSKGLPLKYQLCLECGPSKTECRKTQFYRASIIDCCTERWETLWVFRLNELEINKQLKSLSWFQNLLVIVWVAQKHFMSKSIQITRWNWPVIFCSTSFMCTSSALNPTLRSSSHQLNTESTDITGRFGFAY